MILLDTSVWVDHLRRGDPAVSELLEEGQVLTHPFVIGELALGRLQQRDQVLGALHDLPRTFVAGDAEVLSFIEGHAFFGRGIGYVDAHLLAAARLTPGALLWTRDRALSAAADRFGLAAEFDG